jgi:hypothetical protein
MANFSGAAILRNCISVSVFVAIRRRPQALQSGRFLALQERRIVLVDFD